MFPVPLKLPPAGWQSWCGGRMVQALKGTGALALTAASAAVCWSNFHPIATSIGSIGLGLGLQCLASTCIPDTYSSRVEQVCQTIWGQSTFMLGTQIVVNFPATRGVGMAALGAMLGVNLALWGKKWKDNHFALPVESSLPDDELGSARAESPESEGEWRGGRFQPFSWAFSDVACSVVKASAAAVCLATWFQFSNRLVRSMALWGAAYYASEPLGQFGADFVAQRIVQEESPSSKEGEGLLGGLSQLKQSAWRRAQTAIATLSYLANPLTLIPWGKPHSAARINQLWITGLSMGFFSGFLYGVQAEELKKPIDQISALKPRSPAMENRAFRIWETVWPSLVLGGVTVFVASQLIVSRTAEKIAMGVMYSGYLYAIGKGWAIERYWNQEKRCVRKVPTRWDRIVDGRVVSQILPRIAAINPIHFYYVIENLMALRSGQNLSTFEQVLRNLALFCYGKGMGTEFEQTRSERRGSLFFSPTLLLMNGILSMYLYGAGASDE